MQNPKISVVIPVYNGEKTLRKCLNSILNQTYKHYEVIVVDNNSTDKTKRIIEEFQHKDKKIKSVFESYRSRGAARNAGVNVAKGKIIAMTDADCVVPENWIQELIKPIVEERESVVMGFEKDLIGNFWTKNIQKSNWQLIKRSLNGDYVNHIDTKNFAIKTGLIKKMRFDPKLNNFEDFDLYLRLKGKIKIRFVPEIKVEHNHKSSFASFVINNFDRAYWATRIMEKHKDSLDLKKEVITESISFMNFFTFPFWMIFQFIKRPFGEAYFVLISEISWRIVIIWALIKRI